MSFSRAPLRANANGRAAFHCRRLQLNVVCNSPGELKGGPKAPMNGTWIIPHTNHTAHREMFQQRDEPLWDETAGRTLDSV